MRLEGRIQEQEQSLPQIEEAGLQVCIHEEEQILQASPCRGKPGEKEQAAKGEKQVNPRGAGCRGSKKNESMDWYGGGRGSKDSTRLAPRRG